VAANIETAIEVLLANPQADQDATLAALVAEGFTPREAWRAYQFLPIAFIHVALRGSGVRFEPSYLLMNPETAARTQHRFEDEPLYVEGVKVAERLVATGYSARQFLPVLGRSAEYHAIRQLRRPDGDLRGIGLTEPILMEFQD
jgi:hypothetical protein